MFPWIFIAINKDYIIHAEVYSSVACIRPIYLRYGFISKYLFAPIMKVIDGQIGKPHRRSLLITYRLQPPILGAILVSPLSSIFRSVRIVGYVL
jgi:hypothetical protein